MPWFGSCDSAQLVVDVWVLSPYLRSYPVRFSYMSEQYRLGGNDIEAAIATDST